MELAQRFFDLFKGLERAHGSATIKRGNAKNERGKVEASSVTVKEPASPALWTLHLAGKYGLGVFPLRDDQTCGWGAIDVDVYDLNLVALEKSVTELELPLTVCRTKSGGAHLYLFVKGGSAPARLVRDKLMDWAVALGHGGVEVFPKQTRLANEQDYGNWLNMPYAGGERTLRYALHNGVAVSAEEFLNLAEARAVSPEQLQDVKPKLAVSDFDDGPPCLQSLAQRGFPASFRNNAMFNICVYLKKRYGDDWKKYVDTANQAYFTEPLGHEELASTVKKSAGRKQYNYKCSDSPIREVCNRQICLTRKCGVGDGEDEMNVALGGFVKMKTDPITWLVDVNGERIELETTAIMDQNKFHQACIERLSVWPRAVPRDAWKKIISEKIASSVEQEVPTDARPAGQLLLWLEQFCTGDLQATQRDELLTGRPWTDRDRGITYFKSGEFQGFLERNRVKGWTEGKLWRALRKIGAEHTQFHIKGKNVQCWSIAAFKEQNEEFDVPRTGNRTDF